MGVAAFNQEKALVGAFSVIVQLHRLIVYSTTLYGFVSSDPRQLRPSASAAAAGKVDCNLEWREARPEIGVKTNPTTVVFLNCQFWC